MLQTYSADAVGNVPERFVRIRELRTLTGLGRSTIHRYMNAGKFPRSFHLYGSSKLAVWRYSEVAAWIADRIQEAA
jgi:prophage regulatory protein